MTLRCKKGDTPSLDSLTLVILPRYSVHEIEINSDFIDDSLKAPA
jgi:hypothetical protein